MEVPRVLNWRDAVKVSLGDDVRGAVVRDASALVTVARQRGIGKPISFQKTEYCDADLSLLSVLLRWWSFLGDVSDVGWRNAETTHEIQSRAVSSLVNSAPLEMYAVFCPSYRLGDGEHGYTGIVGERTKRRIRAFSDFVLGSEERGMKMTATAFFSDLLLENLKKLKGTSYRKDLKENFKSFSDEVKKTSHGQITPKLLSSVGNLGVTVGESGVRCDPSRVDPESYRRVFERNLVFYRDHLGWPDEMVKERTDVLFGSYAAIGTVTDELFPEGIMFWVESAYERGVMYGGFRNEHPIPIIYPKRHE